MSAKDEFLKTYTDNIHRDGADKLLEWLKNSDFFAAPASAKYHGNHEGGLCEHSVNVFNRLVEVWHTNHLGEPIENAETIAICGLLHDLCKVNFYVTSIRNVKNADRRVGTGIRITQLTTNFLTGTAKNPFTSFPDSCA